MAIAEGINTSTLPVSLLKNRNGATQDQWVLLFGDSHAWGQGSPESQTWTTAVNVSVHSANIYNKGFMGQLADDISRRRGFCPATYGAWGSNYPTIGLRPGFYANDALSRSANDPSQVFPLIPVVGKISGSLTPLSSYGSLTNSRFYTPAALSATYAGLFREKLSTGLFGLPMLTLTTEGVNEFQESGKSEFLQLTVNPARVPSGTGFVIYTNDTGGIYAERNSSTNDLYLSTVQPAASLPAWIAVGNQAFVPGYGLIKFGSIATLYGGSTIGIVTPSGAPLGGTAILGCLRDGMRLYHPAYVQKCVCRVPMQAPARALYIAIRHKPAGGMLYLYFTDNLGTGGGGNEPYLSGALARASANDLEWCASPSAGSVVAGPNGVLSAASKVTVNPVNFQIDTSSLTAGVTEEVIYRIDFGSTQIGDLFIEAYGSCDTRGVILDNNKVVNLAMGGHSIGGWLGLEASYSSETADHVAQILNHVPVQPSHVITQLPLVNEYLRQTPIATFINNLVAFVNRFRNHLPASNNFNAKGVDFLFFTSLRNKPIAFEGAAQQAITYDLYVQVARSICVANGCAFVDAEAALFDEVSSGRVDYQRLYNDDNHPSDYANELIFREVQKVLAVMV
ncbi:SGNH/GDSL hydrolase family protein [Pseudomonas sp. SDO52101_S400]